MNKTRLRKLAALLKTVPKRQFDMCTWGDPKGGIMKKTATCTTRACALGWATAIPEFAKLGLQLFAEPGDDYVEVHYKGETDAEAGEKFFSLTSEQASWLFYGGADTPKEKAAEIESLVRGEPIPERF